MFSRILVPVDVDNLATLHRAVICACDLARHYEAELIFASVVSTGAQVGALKTFAFEHGSRFQVATHAAPIQADPEASDIGPRLVLGIQSIAPDLVVMASHEPGIMDDMYAPHGAQVVSGCAASVMLIR